MPVNTPQEQKPSAHTKSTKPVLHIIPVVAFIFAIISMFLLGCFVIGPWFKNRHQLAVSTAAPTVTTDADRSPLPVPYSSSRAAHPEVTIKEVPQSNSIADSPTPTDSKDIETDTSAHQQEVDNSEQAPTPLENLNEQDSQATPKDLPADTQPNSEDDASIQPLFRVRAGIFADKANADALSAKLSSAGFAPAVYHIERSGRQFYAVQLGAFRKRENAEELARSLRDAGFDAVIAVEK